MDNTSKVILKRIINSEEQTIYFRGFDEPFEDIASRGAVNSAINHLSKHNYVNVIYNGDSISEITIAYRGLHPIRYSFKHTMSYMLDNWIAIAALIVSIFALLKP